MHKLKLILIIFIIVATIVTCINPVYPHEQFLQHAGTLLLLIPLFVDLRHDHMPMSAFAGIVLFTLLHVIEMKELKKQQERMSKEKKVLCYYLNM